MNPPPKALVPPFGFLAVLIAISAINPLAINIFVSSLPGMVKTFDTDFGTIQLTLSLYLFATAVAQLVIGPLSDRFGRRPVLLAGLALFVIAGAMCTFADSLTMLFAGRVLQGIGGCAGIVTGRAIVRDRYDRDQAVTMLAYLTMGYATVPMIAPAIGGIVDDHFGWRATFALVTIIGLITTLWAWRALPETGAAAARVAQDAAFAKGLLTLVRIPAFWAYTLVAAFGTAGFFAFLGGAPFVSANLLGLGGTEFGIYFFFISLAYIAGNFISARLASRFGLFALIAAGAAIMLAAAAIMAVLLGGGWVSPLTVFGPMCVVTFANGLVLTNGIAGSVSVRPELAGAASGLSGSVQVTVGALASIIVGWWLTADQTAMPLAISIVAFSAATVVSGLWARTARA